MRARPLVGRTSPARTLSRVLLPDPFGPTSPRLAPSATVSDRSRSGDRSRFPSRRLTETCSSSTGFIESSHQPGGGHVEAAEADAGCPTVRGGLEGVADADIAGG